MSFSKTSTRPAEWGDSDDSASEYQESVSPDPSSEDGSEGKSEGESEGEFPMLDLDELESFNDPCETTVEDLAFLAEGMPEDKEVGEADETSRPFDFSDYEEEGLHDGNVESAEYYRRDIDEDNYKRRPYAPGTANQIDYAEYQWRTRVTSEYLNVLGGSLI